MIFKGDCMFILAQVFSGIALVLMVWSFQVSKRLKILCLQLPANFFYALSYFCLSSFAGGVGVCISLIRTFVILMYEIKNKRCPFYLFIFFEFLTIVGCIAFWTGATTLLPMLALVIFTFGMWQEDEMVFKFCASIYCVIIIAYNCLIDGYINIVLESINLGSIILYFLKKMKIKKAVS